MASKQQLHFAHFAVFFPASALMLAGKGAAECNGHSVCLPFEMPPCGNSVDYRCVPWALFGGQCIHPNAMPSYAKKIEEHPNLLGIFYGVQSS
ncbi:unnamed protein product [Cuscuta europaea]|uniref:Secreted protein n=1 Tax=Cuscuta europaea TaxID=41803 RepID=A0A9P1ECN9_CUSEU|nr:unnamed protein product [Cuscuta europaea]